MSARGRRGSGKGAVGGSNGEQVRRVQTMAPDNDELFGRNGLLSTAVSEAVKRKPNFARGNDLGALAFSNSQMFKTQRFLGSGPGGVGLSGRGPGPIMSAHESTQDLTTAEASSPLHGEGNQSVAQTAAILGTATAGQDLCGSGDELDGAASASPRSKTHVARTLTRVAVQSLQHGRRGSTIAQEANHAEEEEREDLGYLIPGTINHERGPRRRSIITYEERFAGAMAPCCRCCCTARSRTSAFCCGGEGWRWFQWSCCGRCIVADAGRFGSSKFGIQTEQHGLIRTPSFTDRLGLPPEQYLEPRCLCCCSGSVPFACTKRRHERAVAAAAAAEEDPRADANRRRSTVFSIFGRRSSTRHRSLIAHQDNKRWALSAAEEGQLAMGAWRPGMSRTSPTMDPNSIIVDPRTAVIRWWDLFMLALLVFTAIVTPFEVGFLETSVNALFFINRVVDLAFTIDLILHFFLAYLDDDGQWEVLPERIAARYLMSWFFIDFVSVLPFDSMGFLLGYHELQQLSAFRVIRVLRLAKLARILRAGRIFQRLQAHMSISFAWLRLMRFAITVLVVSHWMACLLGLVVSIEDYHDAATGEPLNWTTEYEYQHSPTPGQLYLSALYWAIATITTIGFGDVIAVTPGERLLSVVVMLVGAAIFSYIVGAVCAIVTNMDEASVYWQAILDRLNLYMSENNFPQDLRVRLRRYFQFVKQLQRSKFYRSLLADMSPALRREVAVQINRVWVMRVPFFLCTDRDETERFLTEISLVMEPEAFARGEHVVQVGESTTKMYVLQRGVCSRLGRVLFSGAVIGQDVILHDARRSYNVTALTYANLSSISRVSIELILETGRFPRILRSIRRHAARMSLLREFLHYAKLLRVMLQVYRGFRIDSVAHLHIIDATIGVNYNSIKSAMVPGPPPEVAGRHGSVVGSQPSVASGAAGAPRRRMSMRTLQQRRARLNMLLGGARNVGWEEWSFEGRLRLTPELKMELKQYIALVAAQLGVNMIVYDLDEGEEDVFGDGPGDMQAVGLEDDELAGDEPPPPPPMTQATTAVMWAGFKEVSASLSSTGETPKVAGEASAAVAAAGNAPASPDDTVLVRSRGERKMRKMARASLDEMSPRRAASSSSSSAADAQARVHTRSSSSAMAAASPEGKERAGESQRPARGHDRSVSVDSAPSQAGSGASSDSVAAPTKQEEAKTTGLASPATSGRSEAGGHSARVVSPAPGGDESFFGSLDGSASESETEPEAQDGEEAGTTADPAEEPATPAAPSAADEASRDPAMELPRLPSGNDRSETPVSSARSGRSGRSGNTPLAAPGKRAPAPPQLQVAASSSPLPLHRSTRSVGARMHDQHGSPLVDPQLQPDELEQRKLKMAASAYNLAATLRAARATDRAAGGGPEGPQVLTGIGLLTTPMGNDPTVAASSRALASFGGARPRSPRVANPARSPVLSSDTTASAIGVLAATNPVMSSSAARLAQAQEVGMARLERAPSSSAGMIGHNALHMLRAEAVGARKAPPSFLATPGGSSAGFDLPNGPQAASPRSANVNSLAILQAIRALDAKVQRLSAASSTGQGSSRVLSRHSPAPTGQDAALTTANAASQFRSAPPGKMLEAVDLSGGAPERPLVLSPVLSETHHAFEDPASAHRRGRSGSRPTGTPGTFLEGGVVQFDAASAVGVRPAQAKRLAQLETSASERLVGGPRQSSLRRIQRSGSRPTSSTSIKVVRVPAQAAVPWYLVLVLLVLLALAVLQSVVLLQLRGQVEQLEKQAASSPSSTGWELEPQPV